jgi:hypothetical protein
MLIAAPDPKRTIADIKRTHFESFQQQAEAWRRHEEAQVTPDERARASEIRRYLEDMARYAVSKG